MDESVGLEEKDAVRKMHPRSRGHAPARCCSGGVFGFTSSNQTNVFTAESESTWCFAGLEDSSARAGR